MQIKLPQPVKLGLATLLLVVAGSFGTHAQGVVNTDSLLQVAQRFAEQKNYTAARQQARIVLQQAPQYEDASLLIGRTYAWEKKYDSARVVLQPLLTASASPQYVLFALAQVELWSGDAGASLDYAEQGLRYEPNSNDLILAKVYAMRDLEQYKEASAFVSAALKDSPANQGLLEVQEQLQELSQVNRVSLNYQLSTFNQDIANWQLATIQYSRKTAVGTFAGKLNLAERYGQRAVQGELEAWPRLTEKAYLYLNLGVSDSDIFPDYRGGAEFYHLLPYHTEASLGLRSLVYNDETVWLYTGHVGKYFHKYWAAFRPFLQYQKNEWQVTNTLQVRRYFRHSDEFITLSLSKGSTPVEQVALQEIRRLDARKVGLEGQFRLRKQLLLGGLLQFEQEEYSENDTRNRFTSGLSLQYKF